MLQTYSLDFVINRFLRNCLKPLIWDCKVLSKYELGLPSVRLSRLKTRFSASYSSKIGLCRICYVADDYVSVGIGLLICIVYTLCSNCFSTEWYKMVRYYIIEVPLLESTAISETAELLLTHVKAASLWITSLSNRKITVSYRNRQIQVHVIAYLLFTSSEMT